MKWNHLNRYSPQIIDCCHINTVLSSSCVTNYNVSRNFHSLSIFPTRIHTCIFSTTFLSSSSNCIIVLFWWWWWNFIYATSQSYLFLFLKQAKHNLREMSDDDCIQCQLFGCKNTSLSDKIEVPTIIRYCSGSWIKKNYLFQIVLIL